MAIPVLYPERPRLRDWAEVAYAARPPFPTFLDRIGRQLGALRRSEARRARQPANA